MSLYSFAVGLVLMGAALAVCDALLLICAPRLLRFLSRRPAASRPDAILLARSAPLLVSALLGVCILLPAWWRYEPVETAETVSGTLVIAAILALAPLLQGGWRAARMFLRTNDRLLLWKRRGSQKVVADTGYEVVEVRSPDLALCVGGLLTPTIYASTEVINSLDPAEWAAALAHEASHAATRDPLRLLWMASCPDFLRLFGGDQPWRRAFSSACEFAADAGASHGDQEVALDLASALLKVARIRPALFPGGDALADVALSPAFSNSADLEARIHALSTASPNSRKCASVRPS